MLYHSKKISMDVAVSRSSEPDELKQMIANPGAVLKRQIQTGGVKPTAG